MSRPEYVLHEKSLVALDETWCELLLIDVAWTDRYPHDVTCGNCRMEKELHYKRAQEVIDHVKAKPVAVTLGGISEALRKTFAPELVRQLNRPAQLPKILQGLSDIAETDTSTDDKGK